MCSTKGIKVFEDLLIESFFYLAFICSLNLAKNINPHLKITDLGTEAQLALIPQLPDNFKVWFRW